MEKLRTGLAGLNREVGGLCVIVFIADIVSGILSPTFSLFAQGLGISLGLLGLIMTVAGLSQLLFSLPIGILSDRAGRRRIVILGLSAFAAMMLIDAVARGPALLAFGQIFDGIAVVGSFSIAAAHLGDISEPGHRAVAFGAMTTAMGGGYAIGPLLGSQLSQHFGTRVAYLVGAGLAIAGALLVPKLLHDRRAPAPGQRIRKHKLLDGLQVVIHQHDVLVAAFGSLLMNVSFAGAVITFFPIYGDSLHWAEATIGSLFAVRALVSTIGRFPNGIIARKIGIRTVMSAALAIEAGAMFGIGSARGIGWLTLLLALEGVAFGAYLVSGQAYVAERTTIEVRGAAVGLYSTTGSVGGTAGPLILGIVAQTFGVATVFTVTGWLLAIGALVFIGSMLRLNRSLESISQGAPAPVAGSATGAGEESTEGNGNESDSLKGAQRPPIPKP